MDDAAVPAANEAGGEGSPAKRKRSAEEDDADDDAPDGKKVSFGDSDKSSADKTDKDGEDDAMDVDKDESSKDDTDAAAAPAPRRRFARAKLGKMSAPLKAALEKKQAQQAASAKVEQTMASRTKESTGGSAVATSTPRSLDSSSASFRPDVIAAESEGNQSEEMKAAAAANLESVIRTEEEGDDPAKYIDFFWTDAKEHPARKGVILLFGKVEVNAAADGKRKGPPSYVSCCVAVQGNSRNLFVLPRKKADSDEYKSMMDVHSELKSVLQPSCIPNVEGASWGGKVVDRRYAFHDASVPREETKYLKVVYDAKYPVPAEEVCMEGGRYFQKIFGAGATNLENFIIKRK